MNKKVPMSRGAFIDPQDVEAAKARSEAVANSSDFARKISEEAPAAIQEIEDIYYGGATYDAKKGVYRARQMHSDDLIDWIKSTGMDPETLKSSIQVMKVGEVKVIKDRAFIKTPTNEFQEVGAYTNRLEKTLLSFIDQNKTLKQETEALKVDLQTREARETVGQLLRRAFRKLFRRTHG